MTCEKPIIFLSRRGVQTAMAQMTATPVATQGFLLDGKWIEEGDPVEVCSPYDGAVVGRMFQGRREHAEAAIAAAVKPQAVSLKKFRRECFIVTSPPDIATRSLRDR